MVYCRHKKLDALKCHVNHVCQETCTTALRKSSNGLPYTVKDSWFVGSLASWQTHLFSMCC